ncbi:MAG TPA: hypothetical protein VFH59_07760 [Frateuria sp.]|uniref:hypothetical protein n=1 Tax=Frateuria sp. TaxID=2211372 RepID=UPI002D806176|nr:hypothetical protein [Frateuria sp.]HET6805317.1 hypothetical protein [Frateuria sp.]
MKPQQKSLALHIKAAAAVDEATLAAINAFTLREFTAEELQVREYVLAHNCIDRDNEVFDESLLDDFARTIPGKGVYIIHPTSWEGDGGPAEGRVFAAETKTMPLEELRTMLREPDLQLPPDRTTAKVLITRAFFAKTPENASLLIKQDAGIAGDVSIGFEARQRVPIVDRDGRELTARRWMGPGKALEMSLVWLGAQPGARAVKNAPRSNDTHPEPTMDLTQEQIADLQAKAASGEKNTTLLTALKTALGADAGLLDNPDQLKAHIADAKAYKTALIEDVIATERQLGVVGDAPEDVEEAKTFYANMGVDKLKAVHKGLEKRVPNRQGGMKGANTNQGALGSQQAPEDSPIHNPALAAA